MQNSTIYLLLLSFISYAYADSIVANAPTSSDSSVTFEMQRGDNSSWTAVNVSSVDLSSTYIAWRIAGDEDSSVVLTFNSSNSLKGYGGADIALDVTTTINTTYDAIATVLPSLLDIPVKQTLIIQNLYCANDQKFTALAELANGTIIHKTSINYLTVDLPPTTSSVNVTDIDLGGIVTDSTILSYHDASPLTARVGEGSNVPSFSASSVAKLEYCTEDD